MAVPYKPSGSFQYQSQYESNPFPNEDIDPKIKEKDEFGLKMGRAIYFKWQYDNYQAGHQFRINQNRMYARGRQNVDQYKPYLLDTSLDNLGDKSWMNIDWSIESPAPLVVKRLVGRLMNIDFKIQANSIDGTSAIKKAQERDALLGKMYQRKVAAQLEKVAGIELPKPKGYVPEDEEDLEMYMEMEYRAALEIAMEQLEDFEFSKNDWKEIKARILRDLVENNIGALRLYYDETDSIRMRYWDIEYLIKSYSSDPYYKDLEYAGCIVELTIRDIRRLSNGKLSEEDLFKIAKMYAGRANNSTWRCGDVYMSYTQQYLYDDYRIPCLDFVYYTTDVYKYEKKVTRSGKEMFKKTSYEAQQSDNPNRELVQKQIEMEYEGLWVLDTNYMVNYGRSRNISRPQHKNRMSPQCLKKVVIIEPTLYNGRSISLIEQCIPNFDAIQISVLKKRHIMAEAIPPGLAIDWDGLNEVAIAMKEKPLTLVKLYKQKGVLLRKSKDINENMNYAQPLELLINGYGQAIQPFVNEFQTEFAKIMTILGLNTPADASQPDKRSLVGIEQLALLESNNATRELFEAFNHGIYERAATVVARMIQDKIRYGNGMEEYADVIGELSVKHIDFLPDELPLIAFGIKIEAMPDAYELQDLLVNINKAMEIGEISFEDSLEIKSIMNTKKAARVLAYKKKRRQREKMEEKAQEQAMIAEREQANILAAAEAEKAKAMAKAQAEAMIIQAKLAAEKELETHKTEQRIKEIDREGMWKEKLVEAGAAAELNKTTGSEVAPQPKVFSNPIEAATRVME